MTAYTSDWRSMGIDYGPVHNAFTACPPRSTIKGECTEPKKRGPKSAAQRTVESLMTEGERLAARTAKVIEFKGPVHNYGSLSDTPEGKAKTARLIGKPTHKRSA